MNKTTLEGLSRREIQSIAKQRGIKANQKSKVLIELILQKDEGNSKEVEVEVESGFSSWGEVAMKVGEECEVLVEGEGKGVKVVRINKKSVRFEEIISSLQFTLPLTSLNLKPIPSNQSQSTEEVEEEDKCEVESSSEVSNKKKKKSVPDFSAIHDKFDRRQRSIADPTLSSLKKTRNKRKRSDEEEQEEEFEVEPPLKQKRESLIPNPTISSESNPTTSNTSKFRKVLTPVKMNRAAILRRKAALKKRQSFGGSRGVEQRVRKEPQTKQLKRWDSSPGKRLSIRG